MQILIDNYDESIEMKNNILMYNIKIYKSINDVIKYSNNIMLLKRQSLKSLKN